MLNRLPEWAKLARLSEDELVLVAYYRSCTPDHKETVTEFCRLTAEICNKGSPSSGNVVFLPTKISTSI